MPYLSSDLFIVFNEAFISISVTFYLNFHLEKTRLSLTSALNCYPTCKIAKNGYGDFHITRTYFRMFDMYTFCETLSSPAPQYYMLIPKFLCKGLSGLIFYGPSDLFPFLWFFPPRASRFAPTTWSYYPLFPLSALRIAGVYRNFGTPCLESAPFIYYLPPLRCSFEGKGRFSWSHRRRRYTDSICLWFSQSDKHTELVISVQMP